MAEDKDDQDQLFVLSRMGVQLLKDMQQKWNMAYKQDQSHKTAFNQLHQGKPVDKYYLTPIGLMAMMVGTLQKIIVP